MAALSLNERRQCRAVIDETLAGWLHRRPAAAAEVELLRSGIAAAALANARDLVGIDHLTERNFWEPYSSGVLPGLPCRASFGRVKAPAPELGADTAAVLREVLGLGEDQITELSRSGVFG
jgi:crotonobetainyl-CoA:carnitine CoA-transferase CaiB-like acyl-CoA transferase